MKEQKSEFTLWLGICAIIGLFVWQMPNIERLLFGRAKRVKTEEVKEEIKEEPTIKNGRITCGISLTDNANMEYIILYEDSKIKKVITTNNTIFDKKDDAYNTSKKACENVSVRYANQKGFVATCNVNGLTIVNKQEFDLKSFNGASIANDDGTTENISLGINFNDNVDATVEALKETGATCK